MNMDGQTGRCYFSRGLFPGELRLLYQVTALVHLPCSSPLLHEQSAGHCHATGWRHPSYQHCIQAWGLTGSRSSQASPACPPGTLPLAVPPLPDIPFIGTPLVGHPFAEFLDIPTQKKWDCPSSCLLSNHHDKRTYINFQEVEARSEHSSAPGDEDMPKLVSEAGPSFKQQQGQEPTSPSSCPTRALLILMTVLQQEAQGVPVIRPHLTQTHPGMMWLTLIWVQPPGTTSLAQTQMKWLYELSRRSAGRGYEFPVGSAKAASGLTEKDQWHPPGHVGTWPWEHTNRVASHSCGQLQLLWDVQDDGQGWSTAPHCHSQQLPYLHQRLRGWDPWLGKDSGIVAETIPHPLLPFLWKGND